MYSQNAIIFIKRRTGRTCKYSWGNCDQWLVFGSIDAQWLDVEEQWWLVIGWWGTMVLSD